MIIAITLLVFVSIGLAVYLNKPSFETEKQQLNNLYSTVLSDMNVDYRNNQVGAVNIGEISKSIQNFANKVDTMNERVQKENTENQKWFIEMIQEFTDNLHIWIDRHASELELLDNQLKSTKTSQTSEKAILELASKRLKSHINLLQKV